MVSAPHGAGRIVHARTHDAWQETLQHTVEMLAGLDPSRSKSLCELGSVYVDGQRTMDGSHVVRGSALVRMHTRPRRYPVLDRDGWMSRVLFSDHDFLVIHKPSGVPVHPSLDNAVESCQKQLEAALGGEPLWCPHRLDVPTRGLLVLARRREFLVSFNRALQEGRVHKAYHALCQPVGRGWRLPQGTMIHYQQPTKRAPVHLSPIPVDGWLRCESAVLGALPCAVHFAGMPADIGTLCAEMHMQLGTGRTHQLRAQLAYAGWPILGDGTYGASPQGPASESMGRTPEARVTPPAKAVHVDCGMDDFFGLVASSLRFMHEGKERHFEIHADRRWRQ